MQKRIENKISRVMNALPINNREKTLITSVETTLYNKAATNRELQRFTNPKATTVASTIFLER